MFRSPRAPARPGQAVSDHDRDVFDQSKAWTFINTPRRTSEHPYAYVTSLPSSAVTLITTTTGIEREVPSSQWTLKPKSPKHPKTTIHLTRTTLTPHPVTRVTPPINPHHPSPRTPHSQKASYPQLTLHHLSVLSLMGAPNGQVLHFCPLFHPCALAYVSRHTGRIAESCHRP